METITLDDLVNAGFAKENWPEDLPKPGEDNISGQDSDGSQETYRFEVSDGGSSYAMEVTLDRSTVPDPAEGVVFMLNQFAYLWRTDKDKIDTANGTRRINF